MCFLENCLILWVSMEKAKPAAISTQVVSAPIPSPVDLPTSLSCFAEVFRMPVLVQQLPSPPLWIFSPMILLLFLLHPLHTEVNPTAISCVWDLMWLTPLHVCLGLWASHGLMSSFPWAWTLVQFYALRSLGDMLVSLLPPPPSSFPSLSLAPSWGLMLWFLSGSPLWSFQRVPSHLFQANLAYLLFSFLSVFKKNLNLWFIPSQTIALKRKIPLNSECVAPGWVTGKRFIYPFSSQAQHWWTFWGNVANSLHLMTCGSSDGSRQTVLIISCV